jgi:hypothetical protein
VVANLEPRIRELSRELLDGREIQSCPSVRVRKRSSKLADVDALRPSGGVASIVTAGFAE